MKAAKQQWLKENLNPGEVYVGILLGVDGQPDQHIILLPGEAEGVSWDAAKHFAQKAGGGLLPTRREQALLVANAKHEFKPSRYWSWEQHAAVDGYAWCQYFNDGLQDFETKSVRLRARAVRKLVIS